MLLHGLTAPAWAESRLQVRFLLSDAGGAYAEVVRAAQAGLGPSVDSQVIIHGGNNEAWTQAIKPDDLVIPLGLKAVQAVAQLDRPGQVLAALLPRQAFESAIGNGDSPAPRRAFSALVLDQPFERQFAFIRLVLPKADKVGVLLGRSTAGLKSDLIKVGQQSGVRVNVGVVDNQNELFASQRELLRESDALLAIPDPLVLNQTTLMSYLITAYRMRVPIVGFSQSFVDAGALAAVYSTPQQIGRQLSEIIAEMAAGKTSRPARLLYPRYFKVHVNRQIARSLEFDVAPDDWLQRQLELKAGTSL